MARWPVASIWAAAIARGYYFRAKPKKNSAKWKPVTASRRNEAAPAIFDHAGWGGIGSGGRYHDPAHDAARAGRILHPNRWRVCHAGRLQHWHSGSTSLQPGMPEHAERVCDH